MPANTSITSFNKGFEPGTNCYYKTYTDPNDLSHYEVEKEPAMCGYDPNGYAYCNQHIGDSDFQSFLSILQSMNSMPDDVCHSGSISVNCAFVRQRYPDIRNQMTKAGIQILHGGSPTT